MARQALDAAFRHGGGGNPAAVGARQAIDPILNAFRYPSQNAVGMGVRFHEAPEAQVLLALLLAQKPDL
jgi:hypothetical protein